MSNTVLCADAIRAKRTADRNLARWEGMVQAIGLAFTIVTVVFVIALIWGNSPSRFATGVTTLAASAGLGVVLKNRSSAKQDVVSARKDLRQDCQGQQEISGERGAAPGSTNTAVLPVEIYDALVD